jgi:dTDP-4-amino-4,6-dideoxygalactose transaminase
MYTLLMESKNKRDSLQRYLSDNGVMSKVYFQPTHLKTYYKKRGSKEGDLLVTESVSDRVLTIPLYIELTQHELDNIVTLIRRFEKDGRD